MSEQLTNFVQQLKDEEILALRAEIERLREAIRRLADQDATLSVCEGAVTVQMDATLTDAEREALEFVAGWLEDGAIPDTINHSRCAAIRGMLERLGGVE